MLLPFELSEGRAWPQNSSTRAIMASTRLHSSETSGQCSLLSARAPRKMDQGFKDWKGDLALTTLTLAEYQMMGCPTHFSGLVRSKGLLCSATQRQYYRDLQRKCSNAVLQVRSSAIAA